MTIASEITRIQNNIAGAYTALSAKGATMPATQNSANLATTVTSVPAGSGYVVTATNSSSYDRITGEKVWLSKSGDDYSIINYTSANINSLIGTCKQNIAIGASGSVETLDNGTLVPHLARDFTLGAGITESNIDDADTLFTMPLAPASSYIVSNEISLPSTESTNFKFKIKFKYINNDSGTTPTLPICTLGKLNFNNSTSYPSGYEPLIFTNESVITGQYPYSYNRFINVNYNAEGILDFDNWLTVSIETSSTSPYATLKIVDVNGNTYTQTSISEVCSFSSNNVQRVCIGKSSDISGSTLSAVFDLSECGLFSADESTTYWTPYKATEG